MALPRASSSRTCFSPGSSSSETLSENDASPPKARDRVGPAVPLGVRRAGDQAVGVVDPEPALLPGARRQRHQPAQAVGSVLAALVEGVGGDPHRVHQADARQQRRPAADHVDLGTDHLADQRQAGAVGLLAGHVLGALSGDRAGVEEVELEVVDAEVDQSRERLGEQVEDPAVGEVETDQVVAPVAAGRTDQPVEVLGRQRRAGSDEERRHPDARPAAGGAHLVDHRLERPEAVGDDETPVE